MDSNVFGNLYDVYWIASSRATAFNFGLILLGKAWALLFSHKCWSAIKQSNDNLSLKLHNIYRSVVVTLLDYCLIVSEFKLLLNSYTHFRTNMLGKGMNPLFPHKGWSVFKQTNDNQSLKLDNIYLSYKVGITGAKWLDCCTAVA